MGQSVSIHRLALYFWKMHMLAVRHRQHGVISLLQRNTTQSESQHGVILWTECPPLNVSQQFLRSDISINFPKSSYGALEQADEAFAQKLWGNIYAFLTFSNSIFISSAGCASM